MRKNLIRLRFKIDRLSVRERVIFLVTALIVVYFLWWFLFYAPQAKKLQDTQDEIEIQGQAIHQVLQKNQSILNLSKDNTTDKLLMKFALLKKRMEALEQKIGQYHHRYISDKELAKLLYSMLNQVSGVSIEGFSTVTPEGDEKEDTSEVAYALSRGAAASLSSQAAQKKVPGSSNEVTSEEELASIRYTLILKGDFYSIVDYLQRMEHLKWELYWDKLTYEVQTYPLGLVTIEFYTLKPKDTADITTSAPAKAGTSP